MRAQPARDQGCAGAPGGLAGALGGDDPGDGGAGRDARRRMRPGQGARGHDQAHRRRRCRAIALADRASLEQALAALKGRHEHAGRAKSRWSPAPRAASAAPSRSSSGAQGATVVGTATTEAGAAQISDALSEAGIAGRGKVLERARHGAAATRWSRSVQKEFGAGRDPGQQRRHHARQPRPAHEGRGVGRGDRDQSASRCSGCRARCCAA